MTLWHLLWAYDVAFTQLAKHVTDDDWKAQGHISVLKILDRELPYTS